VTAAPEIPATVFVGAELADVLAGPEPWMVRALCNQADPDLFFPEKGGSTREAKRICAGCEVRAECLAYALRRNEPSGIWGGLSERERRQLRRRLQEVHEDGAGAPDAA
jgi:WhiB family transcriptional regulator, redox-sensing transcriptional regulator